MKRDLPLGLLTDRQALMLHLHEVEGLSRAELAARLEVTTSTVSQSLAEARKRVLDYQTHGVNSIYLVPARLRQFLEMVELLKPEDLREAIDSGSLFWSETRDRLVWINPRDKQYQAMPDDSDEDMDVLIKLLRLPIPPELDDDTDDFTQLIGQHIRAKDDDTEETPTVDEVATDQEQLNQEELAPTARELVQSHSPRNLGWKSWQQMHELAGLPIPKRKGDSEAERKVRTPADLSDEELLRELERRPHLKKQRMGKGRG